MTTLKHRAHVLAITPGYVGGKRDHFNQFIRNGRWGACADCPTAETERLTFPELCANTRRSDHHLTLDDLTESYKRELVQMEERIARREKEMKEAVWGTAGPLTSAQ